MPPFWLLNTWKKTTPQGRRTINVTARARSPFSTWPRRERRNFSKTRRKKDLFFKKLKNARFFYLKNETQGHAPRKHAKNIHKHGKKTRKTAKNRKKVACGARTLGARHSKTERGRGQELHRRTRFLKSAHRAMRRALPADINPKK